MDIKEIVINYSQEIHLSNDVNTLLYEIDRKKHIIQRKRPFEEPYLRQVKEFYKIDNVWASEAVEGNSLTLSETKILLEDGITIAGKPVKDILRTCGHGEAYDYMFSLLENKLLTLDDICYMHKLLMQKEDGKIAGIYKQYENFVSGSSYTTIPSEQVEDEMNELADWMNVCRDKLHPVVYAAELHRKLVYIHPFADGNGRTARLAMNAALIQNGYLPCPIAPVIKLEYNNALEAGRGGRTEDFIRVIAEAEHETLKDFGRYMHIDFKKVKDMARGY